MSFATNFVSESFGQTIVASVLSRDLNQALKTELDSMSEMTRAERFKAVCEAVTVRFIQMNFEETPSFEHMQEVIARVEIPTNLAHHYLNEIIPRQFFQRFTGEVISMKEIGLISLEEIDLPSLDEVLSEAHASVVAANEIRMKAEQYTSNPFSIMKEPVMTPAKEESVCEAVAEVLDQSAVEIDEIFPSLESHVLEAHANAEAKAGNIAAEQPVKNSSPQSRWFAWPASIIT